MSNQAEINFLFVRMLYYTAQYNTRIKYLMITIENMSSQETWEMNSEVLKQAATENANT